MKSAHHPTVRGSTQSGLILSISLQRNDDNGRLDNRSSTNVKFNGACVGKGVVGVYDGDWVGFKDGDIDGEFDGACEGKRDGACEGTMEGFPVGEADGLIDGE